ncbi:GPP34 family phosphoprotein [Arthrobacter sp. 4R501]|uniref:GPP34 family phosphoprotein n=1 Tax=Arthrobacter sp. 4R501 TaxID=2058886 RepID=UPI0028007068|nr:GPP34 family phosphoprotein [Arthrobacter sp. 4R501]
MNAEVPEVPKAEELNIPQALLLLATNDMDGESAVPQVVLKAALAGAILAELDLLGAIELKGQHVRATGATPQTDFQHQLELIRDMSRPHSPKRWVSMLESRAELHRVYGGWRRWASWTTWANGTLACSGPRGTRRRTTLLRQRC